MSRDLPTGGPCEDLLRLQKLIPLTLYCNAINVGCGERENAIESEGLMALTAGSLHGMK